MRNPSRRLWAAATLLIACSHPALAGVGALFSEFEPNPNGDDPEFTRVEISGPPDALFSGWILSFESDQNLSVGQVQSADMVSGTFDANGLLTVEIPDIENPSFTLALTSAFTGTVDATTVDDTSAFGTVYDAIGVPDDPADQVFGVQLGGADFSLISDEPLLVFRDGSIGSWFALFDPVDNEVFEVFDVSDNFIPLEDFSALPSAPTFGSVNPSLGPVMIVSNDIATVIENQIAAIDVDASSNAAGALVYSFSGGSDESSFDIDTVSGVVTFKADAPPDFENPHDADQNNNYEIQVTVTDVNLLTAMQDITITVENDPDEDGDGVNEEIDVCPATNIPELSVPSRSLRSNRFVISDQSGLFTSRSNQQYSLADTGGCSCEQILTSSNDERYGCRASTLRRWIRDLPARTADI